jgi:hypothetical protein
VNTAPPAAGPGAEPTPLRPGAEQACVRLLAAAAGWSLLLLVLAVVLPVESIDTGQGGVQPMRSWVAVNGFQVMAFVRIPLLVTLAVGLLLTRARRHRREAQFVAWVLASALLAAAVTGFLTFFLICAYVLPGAGLLLAACGVSRPGRKV